MRSPRLGLPVTPSMGTPGINPNAPDPRVPQGPGLGLQQEAAPPAPAPQMQMPTEDPDDLSGLNAASKIGLLLGNVGAGLQGNLANSPVTQMQAQRRQAYERKRQAFMQGVQMMEKMDKDLETVPLSQRDAKKASQRALMVKMGGDGWGQTYDTLMGEDSTRAAMLEAAKTDQGWAAMMANGDPTPEMFNQYQRGPERMKRITDDFDRAQVDTSVAQFMKLVESNPAARAEAKEMAKDGFTSAEIRAVNAKYGTQGPNGVSLTEAQLGTLDRQQGMLVGRIPGFKTDEQFQKDKDLADAEASTIRINEAKQKSEYDWNTTQAKSGPQISPATRDFMKLEHKKAVETVANTDAALDYLKELDRSLNKAEAVLTNKPVDSDLPVKPGKPDVSDASDERINTGKTRFLPGAGLTQSLTNTDDYSILEQAYGEEWVGKIRTSAPKGAFSDKEGVALERTIGGFGKGNAFNLRDIRERRQFLAELRERKIEERRQATEKRSSIAKRVELDDLGTSVTREGGSTGGAAPADAGAEEIKEIKVNGQWVKARRVKGGWEPVK